MSNKETDTQALLRVIDLYSSALSLIAYHPGKAESLAQYAKSKAQEALLKTNAAYNGEILSNPASITNLLKKEWKFP